MNKRVNLLLCAVATVVLGASAVARADVVTEWNVKGGELITAARPITQQASRMMALAHTAAYEAANAITRRYYRGGAVDRAMEEHLKGRKDHGTLLWTLLNIEIWHRTYTPG